MSEKQNLISHLRAVAVMSLIFFVLLGFAYPGFVAIVAHGIGLGYQADGSLISQNGTVIASKFIGENFSAPYYFWPRVSSVGYNSSNGSGGSALGIATQQFYNQTKNYTEFLIRTGMVPNGTRVPANAVEPSASGFDPDITVGFAYFQLTRVAFYTHLNVSYLQKLVGEHTTYPLFGFIGNTYVNVVTLDIALHNVLLSKGVIT